MSKDRKTNHLSCSPRLKHPHLQGSGGEIQACGKGAEKRGNLRGLIKVILKGIFEKDFFFSTALNISASGILIETDKILAQGDKIVCSFILQHKIHMTGEVVRAVSKATDLYHYGVRFLNLDPNAKTQIEEFVNG